MIDFKPIATTDKELLTSFILPSDEQDCDFSFANLCSWHFMTESSYALIEDHLVIRFVTSEGNHEYFMPLGEGSPIPVIEALEACALSENEPLCLRGVQPKILPHFIRIYEQPGLFRLYLPSSGSGRIKRQALSAQTESCQ